jgi:hypothetical protein
VDEAEITALLDLIAVWDRRHSNGSEASTWKCADVFSDATCYRLDHETLATVGAR